MMKKNPQSLGDEGKRLITSLAARASQLGTSNVSPVTNFSVKELLQSGRYEEAARVLDDYIRSQPGKVHAGLYQMLAQIQLFANHTEAAAEAARGLSSRPPTIHAT